MDQVGVGFKNYNVIHGKFKEWININSNRLDLPESCYLNGELTDPGTWSKELLDTLVSLSPWFEQTAEYLSPKERVKVQATLQAYTTHSISSTVNVANNVTEDFINEIYMNALELGCKGITVYRDGSRSGILVKTEDTTKTSDRPVEIECKVEHFKNEKKDWVAFIGLLNNKPYEIFTGPKDWDVFPIPSAVEKGFIIKVKQEGEPSRYDFRYIDSYGYTNTMGGLSRIFDKEYWNYARFVSALLRNNTPIEQIIKVVEGLSFTNKGMNSWKAGVIRSLKPFVPDGTIAIGAVCENEECKSSNIIYENGCMICRDCGSSKCG